MRLMAPMLLLGALAAPALASPQDSASFDCARAASAHEVAVCASAETRRADAAHAAAFRALRASLSGPQAVALTRSQRQFHAHMVATCNLSGKLPASAEAREAATGCLTGWLEPRTRWMEGVQGRSAGALRLEPRITTATRLHRDPPGSGWLTDDAMPLLLGAPLAATRAFEQEINEIYHAPRPLIGGRESLVGAITRGYEVGMMDERFISLLVSETVDAGTAVAPRENAVNFDLTQGRAIGIDEIFERGAEWRAAMKQALRKDLNHPERFERYIDHVLDEGKEVNWLFLPDRVKVSWVPAAQPGEAVEVPATVFARFIRPGSPYRPLTR